MRKGESRVEPLYICLSNDGSLANFAQPEGEVIVPAPTMAQVTDRRALDMYQLEYTNGTLRAKGQYPTSKQLLINYCFGHTASPMLLCPSTNANLLNHCSSRLQEKVGHCDPSKGVNAIVRWAVEFDPATREWLAQDLSTLDTRIKNGQRGLSLEIVALRSIEQDEEIFIDYGEAWEQAWKQHIAKWKPPIDDGGFIPVSQMNLNVER